MPSPISKSVLWTGYVLSGLVILFLLFDSIIKLVRVHMVLEGFRQLGYDPGLAVPIGLILLACTLLYAIPKTSVFGAVLLTAYLGGAVATHLRLGQPLFSHTLFPIYLGVLLWLGLYLREPRLRNLAPWRR